MRRFRSTDAAEVAETWKQFAPSSRLLGVDEDRCKLDWLSVSAPGFSIVRYEMAADVRSSIEPEDQFFTCRVATDSGGSRDSRGVLDPGRPWASNGRPVHARWEDSATVHAIIFDRLHAEQLARQMSGDDTLTLRVNAPEAVSDSAAAHWDRTFAYLASSLLSGGDAIETTLIGAGLQRHALWTLLAAFPTTFSDAILRATQTTAAPKTVKRALSYISAHAHEPITVDDVARAAHISTRGLQYAFRRSLGSTPSEHLRRARLSGAREDLLNAGPTETLASIAQRRGFTNAARFGVYYREEYGDHPADVLKDLTPSGR